MRSHWPSPSSRTTARLFLGLTVALTIAAFWKILEVGTGSGHAIGVYSWKFIGLLGMTLALGLAFQAVFVLLFTSMEERFGRWLERLLRVMERAGAWNWAAIVVIWVAYVVVVIWRFDVIFIPYLSRLWLFMLFTSIGTFFLLAARRERSFFWTFLVLAIFYGLGLKILSYLPQLSSDPFSLGWSEASRFYYSSLPYARWLYGFPTALSPWHPSRYLLLGLPFLIPGSTIFVHRLWQVILWIGLSILTGYVLARRVGIRSTWPAIISGVWGGLFLLQGPVYYHLLICVILVLVGFDPRKFWKSLLAIVIASIWAGISRVNWFPVPVFLAVTLYLLERPVCEVQKGLRGWWDYLKAPVAWGITGLASALSAQALYILVSGNQDKSQFGSTFTSDLLWYRLFPSPTSGFGILPNILIVTLPLLVVVIGSWLGRRSGWHGLRVLLMSGMLLVLFGGGLVVSTKIGGGSNIHNVDAYMMLLLVIGAYVLFSRPRSEEGGPLQAGPSQGGFIEVRLPWLLALVVVAVPVLWNINIDKPFLRPNGNLTARDLTIIKSEIKKYAGQGEVLFLTQRQLLVFNLVQDVPMIPDYELLTLSEMAISNNQDYLDRFTNDLANHRFALIVADPQRERIQNPRVDMFAEENNAWVEKITRPILTYYTGKLSLSNEGIVFYVPK
jgi:hypothetical protein